MTITNDVISFTNTDFEGLSQTVKDAVVVYVGPGIAAKDAAAKLLNDFISHALAAYTKDRIDIVFQDLEEATQVANSTQKAQIKGFVNQARAVAGLPPIA